MKEIRLTELEKQYLKKEIFIAFFVGGIFILATFFLGFTAWKNSPIDFFDLLLIILILDLIILGVSYRFSKIYKRDLQYNFKVITEEQITAKIEDKDHPSVINNNQAKRKELPESNRNAHRYWVLLGKAKYRVSRDFYKSCRENEMVEIHKAKFSESVFIIKKRETDKYQVLFPD